MAINNKKAVKPTKSAHVKNVPAKAPATVKTVAKGKPASKATPAQKASTAKKVASAPKKVVTKPAPVKKSLAKQAPINKTKASTNNQKTVNKKETKPASKAATKTTAAKKAVPAPKAAPAPKVAVAKKAAPAPKKEAPKKTVSQKVAAKPETKAPAKAPVKKEMIPAAPAKKANIPAKPVAKVPEVAEAKPSKASTTAAAKAAAAKSAAAKQLLVAKAAAAMPKPTATPAARPIEKKPTVIIAHRKLENKSKSSKDITQTPAQYHTETYRSILDEPVVETQGPVYRYSDEELNEFRQIIQTRLEAARKELHYLQGLITHKDEAGTEDTENRFMNMEDGSGAMEREQLAQLASRQIQFMNHLEKALVRIENKTYGVCRVTGKLIDKARLRAVPHATLSIEAKNMMSNRGGN